MSEETYTQNTGSEKRTSSELDANTFKPGPFIAVVKNHLDSQFMGRLEVVLQTKSGSGNSEDEPGKAIPVDYLSPFYGITSYQGTTENEGDQFSQKSYGFWGVPPDVGAKVLVIFAEGGQGFWIGCIQEDYTNMMTPGGPFVSSTFNDQDNTKKLPVVEYNKKTNDGVQRNATKIIKPVNADALQRLTEQGLQDDEFRGTTTSSARRDLPSNVLGFSSPGPSDKRGGAPRVTYGENFAQSLAAQNRLGGSSLVFDDGDPTLIRKGPPGGPDGVGPEYANIEASEEGGDPTRPHNELVRLRTRTGHQILMHNTEDLIYIANSRGTAWIELSSNGKVDIYAASDVSIHSEANMNFKADGNMYFESGADMHFKSGANIFQTSAANLEINVGADGKLTTTANLDFVSGADTRSNAANTHWTAGSHKFKGAMDQNGPTPAEATAATEAEPSQRVPEHEPWFGHEHLHIEEYQTATQEQVVATPDTFAQNTQRAADATPSSAAATAPGTEETPPADPATQTAEEQTGGVLQTPSSLGDALGGITSSLGNLASGITNAIGGLVSGITNATVGALTDAIDFSSITFPSAQTVIRGMDNIASPSELEGVINGTATEIEGVLGPITTEGAVAMRQLRTRLARVNT